MQWGKRKIRSGWGKSRLLGRGWGGKNFNRKIRVVTMKLTTELTYGKVMNLPRTISNKVTPDKGIGYLEGHKVGSCLAYLRNSKEATVSDWRVAGKEVTEVKWVARSCKSLEVIVKLWLLYLETYCVIEFLLITESSIVHKISRTLILVRQNEEKEFIFSHGVTNAQRCKCRKL